MDINLDLDDLVNELFENEEFLDRVVTYIGDAFLDHRRRDQFRMAWMRMMELEVNDLRESTREGACGHGQQMYDGIFHVIRQYLWGEGNASAKEAMGVDGLPQTIQELVSAAVDSKINSVWQGSGYTIDNTIRARLGEPIPIGRQS